MLASSLLCPHCQQQLQFATAQRKTLSCPQGHRFDAAKQGYFNFLTGKGTNFTEDTAAMVAARAEFQSRGHYQPLATAITHAASQGAVTPTRILDAGAGTGYYLSKLVENLGVPDTEAVALDISRYAMRRAAKVQHTTAIVWDVWRTLPSADTSRDLVLNCFAPHNPKEFRRVLAPGGLCLVVTALPDHLQQVREPLGMLGIAEAKQDQLIARFGDHDLRLDNVQELRFDMSLDPQDLFNLAFMGPAGHHLDPDELRQRVNKLGTQEARAAFGIYSFV